MRLTSSRFSAIIGHRKVGLRKCYNVNSYYTANFTSYCRLTSPKAVVVIKIATEPSDVVTVKAVTTENKCITDELTE